MKKFLSIFASVACILIIVLGIDVARVSATTTIDDKIEQGVYIGEIDVSNLTAAEAYNKVQEYIEQIGQATITLNAMNDNTHTIAANELGLTWTNADVVDKAYGLGKQGNIVERYKVLKNLEHESTVLPLTMTVDKQAVASIIEEDCLGFNVEAIDAKLIRDNGAFVIEQGQTGVKINQEASTDNIVNYMTNEWDYQDASIDLVVETAEPRGTEEELSKVTDKMGTFTTSYSTSGSNRSGNVANGCDLINGTTLYPGDEFSVYEAISPFTVGNGYFMAGSYANGLVVDSLGGGICQVSTTLYNAVLRAELEITQRYNHSMIVTYVDPSADAAIAGTAKDLKFINNTDSPIYIEGYTANKKITFNIYGEDTRPENRSVSYESEVLKTTAPEGEKVVADPSQPIGYVHVQSAHTGYVAQLVKIVKVDGVVESKEVVNKSTYKAVPRTAAVGVATSDPNILNAINAAIATQSIDYVRATLAGTAVDPAVAAAQAAQAAAIQQQQAAAAAAAQAAADQAAADQAIVQAENQETVTVTP